MTGPEMSDAFQTAKNGKWNEFQEFMAEHGLEQGETLDAYHSARPADGGHYLERPYIRGEVRQDVEAAADRAPDGRFLDAVKLDPIDGQYDLGHVPDHAFAAMRDSAEAKGWTQGQFNDYMNNPDFYRIENPIYNRSHIHENIP